MLCCFVFCISLSLTKRWTFEQLFLYFSILFLFCSYFFFQEHNFIYVRHSLYVSYLIKNFCWSFKFSIEIFSSSLSSINLTLLAVHLSLLLVCTHFGNEDVVIYNLMSTGFCSYFLSYYLTIFLKPILWNQRMYYFQ